MPMPPPVTLCHDGLDGLLDRHVADQAGAIEAEPQRRRKQANSHRHDQHDAEMQRIDAELDRHRHQ